MLYQAVVKELIGLLNVGLVVSLYCIQDCSTRRATSNFRGQGSSQHKKALLLQEIQLGILFKLRRGRREGGFSGERADSYSSHGDYQSTK